MEHLGNLPDVPGIRDYLLDIPRFLGQYAGKPYLESVKEITGKLLPSKPAEVSAGNIKTAFDDDELDDLNNLIEGLDDNVFGKTNRNTLKLRLYFKPSEVINFLISRGVTNKLFYS
jgi:flagellar biosynthesis protein FlhG